MKNRPKTFLAVIAALLAAGSPPTVARAQVHPPECFSVVHVIVEDVDIDGGGVPTFRKVWDFQRFERREDAERHMRRLAIEGVWDYFGETFYPPHRIIRLRLAKDCV